MPWDETEHGAVWMVSGRMGAAGLIVFQNNLDAGYKNNLTKKMFLLNKVNNKCETNIYHKINFLFSSH